MKNERERLDSHPDVDILSKHLQIVLDILENHVPEEDIWVFGSRAKWTATRISDLDLVVLTDKSMGLEKSGNLRTAFEASDLPYKVDVVDWATTGENFRKIIEKEKVLLRLGRSS